MTPSPWSVDDAKELYNIAGWGKSYFSINDDGNVTVRPRPDIDAEIDVKQLLDELALRDVAYPLLLRFPDILDSRIQQMAQCFDKARQVYDYTGQYYTVYPIKVNQQRQVVQEVVRHGKAFNIGLEAGSKPELHAVLAVMDNPDALIVCNGYKDEDFIELALLAQKMGKRIFLVVEKLNELHLIHRMAKQLNVRPNIGIRIKLSASGSGKWEDSGGEQSKFGLNASELMDAIDWATANDMLGCIRLIHFHLGSQITNIRRLKGGFKEVANFYVQLRQMGCAIDFVDIGGGMGVDYDGTRSTNANSINYDIQEYANDAISIMADAAQKAGIEHPNVISESGRSLTAHHSMLVFNVLEATTHPAWDPAQHTLGDDAHDVVKELHQIFNSLTERSMMEHWHDAVQLRQEALDLFNLGMLSLQDRASTLRLYWSIARRVAKLSKKLTHRPAELELIDKMLADKYFCNFSLFQSLPDSWAIGQVFPIVPLHRHGEEPTCTATLQDITCDSDGKIDDFIAGWTGSADYLRLHQLETGEPYVLGAFLVGAYQEILGDLHNLFGDTNAVHVTMGDDGEYTIDQVIDGETVADVLDYVQFDAKKLVRIIESWVTKSVNEKKISVNEGKEFLSTYRSGLYGYTYLE